MSIKYIIREVPPEQMDASFCFDDDGLTAESGDFNNTLFIVGNSRMSGFNVKELDKVADEIENLYDNYSDITHKSNYAVYSSVGAMLVDYKLVDNIHNTVKIKAYIDFIKDASDSYDPDVLADFLTLKTGKKWDTDCVTGYSQGDYVDLIYCKDSYPNNSAKIYGEIWLGVCKEFCTVEVDENGKEGDTCYGFIVADCQAWKDEDYKRLVCEWEGIKEEDAQLEMIEESHVITKYTYRIV